MFKDVGLNIEEVRLVGKKEYIQLLLVCFLGLSFVFCLSVCEGWRETGGVLLFWERIEFVLEEA